MEKIAYTDAEKRAATAAHGGGTPMPEDTFDDVYRPLMIDDTTVVEFEVAQTFPTAHVWSLVDGDNGSYAIAGFHIVNKFGYCVTHVPWTTGAEQAIWHEEKA